jgi:hypothetical protein
MSRYDPISSVSTYLSEAPTLVNTPTDTFLSRQDSIQYVGPKREYSLVRSGDKKGAFRLVDTPKGSARQMTTGTNASNSAVATPHPLANFVVDRVQQGKALHPEQLIIANLPAKSSTSEARANGDESGQWWSLEVATDHFIPSVVPSWETSDTTEAEQPKKKKLTTTVRSFIKRSKQGFVIRLLHLANVDIDEIAEIEMAGENSRWIDQWLRGTPTSSPDLHKSKGDGVARREFSTPNGQDIVPQEVSGEQTLFEIDSQPAQIHTSPTQSTLPLPDPPRYSYAIPLHISSAVAPPNIAHGVQRSTIEKPRYEREAKVSSGTSGSTSLLQESKALSDNSSQMDSDNNGRPS